jgi:small subunit ribosomal protein S17
MPKRKLIGKIVSSKTPKTLVVSVERIKEHPKYRKKMKRNKKYKAHYTEGEYKEGQRVIIEECRPISRDKKWKVLSLMKENLQKDSGQES